MWKKLGYYDSLSDEKRTRYIFSMAQCENSGTVISYKNVRVRKWSVIFFEAPLKYKQ